MSNVIKPPVPLAQSQRSNRIQALRKTKTEAKRSSISQAIRLGRLGIGVGIFAGSWKSPIQTCPPLSGAPTLPRRHSLEMLPAESSNPWGKSNQRKSPASARPSGVSRPRRESRSAPSPRCSTAGTSSAGSLASSRSSGSTEEESGLRRSRARPRRLPPLPRWKLQLLMLLLLRLK